MQGCHYTIYSFCSPWLTNKTVCDNIGGFGDAGGFVIYDETAANMGSKEEENEDNEAEDKENM